MDNFKKVKGSNKQLIIVNRFFNIPTRVLLKLNSDKKITTNAKAKKPEIIQDLLYRAKL